LFCFFNSKVEVNIESENEMPIWREAIVRNIDRTTHTISVEVAHKDKESPSPSPSPSSIYLEMERDQGIGIGKGNHNFSSALLSYSLYSEKVCKLYTHTLPPAGHHPKSNQDTDDDDNNNDDDLKLFSPGKQTNTKTKPITTYGRSSVSSTASSSHPYKLSGTTASSQSPSPSSYSMGYGSGYGSGRRHSAGKPLTVNGTVGLGRHYYYAYIMFIVHTVIIVFYIYTYLIHEKSNV
jgi:hypothetical protein